MDYLMEADYSDLIDYLIDCLQNYHADDIIRQIKELETVNIIEEAKPTAAPAAQKPPDVDQTVIGAFEEPSYIAAPAKKTDKKLDREAVSEYRSRPMSCKEIFDASIDILETYLLSVPKILEDMKENLKLDSLSDVVWENENLRHAETQMNIIEAVGSPDLEVQEEIGKIIGLLKKAAGKDRIC